MGAIYRHPNMDLEELNDCSVSQALSGDFEYACENMHA